MSLPPWRRKGGRRPSCCPWSGFHFRLHMVAGRNSDRDTSVVSRAFPPPFPLASPARRARTTLAADFDLLVSLRTGSTPARQRAQADDINRPRAQVAQRAPEHPSSPLGPSRARAGGRRGAEQAQNAHGIVQARRWGPARPRAGAHRGADRAPHHPSSPLGPSRARAGGRH